MAYSQYISAVVAILPLSIVYIKLKGIVDYSYISYNISQNKQFTWSH